MGTEPVKEINLVCDVCTTPIVNSDGRTFIHCEQCGTAHHLSPKSPEITVALSLAALILYVPANVFPFMTMELYGSKSTSTIWQGVVSLADSGSWVLAAIVFLASIVIPLVKLIVLFYLAAVGGNGKNRRFKTSLYRFVEVIGRWSMLDIFLLAIMVAIFKLGHWTTVEPEVGSLLFAFVVIFTLFASANFDPTLIWEKNEKR